MNGGRDCSVSTAQNTEAMITLENVYREACAWFGPMPFEDFAAGYQAMTDWYERRSFSSTFGQTAA